LLAGAFCGFSPAFGQVADPAAQTSISNSAAVSNESGDIVVTAQRRSETVQSVAASIQAFSGAELAKAGIVAASDLAKIVPNLNTYSPLGEGSSPVFVLRGVTSNDYAPNQSRPVALYVDDGIRGSSALEVMQLYDLERVEVLRGPQGTLYGKNASGGAINVITRKPTDTTEGYLTLGYGTFDRIEVTGAAQTPIIEDKLAVRLAFQMIRDDGLVKNLVPDSERLDQTDTLGVRANFAFTPTEQFNANLRLYHSRVGGQGPGLYAKNIAPFLGANRDGLGFYENRSDFNPERRIRNSGLNLNMNYEFDDTLTLTSVTTYDTGSQSDPGDYDGLEIHSDHIDLGVRDLEQFSQELRLSGDFGALKILAGGYYFQDSMEVFNQYVFLGEERYGIPVATGPDYDGPPLWGIAESNSFRQKRKSYAGFLRADYAITDAFNVFGGVRYSHDKVSALNYSAALGGEIETNNILATRSEWRFPNPTFTGIDRSDSFNNVSFEAGADYKIGDALVYATFKQGYRTGAVNGAGFLTPAEITIVKPEEVDGYEIGVKYQSPDRVITVNLSAFRNDYTNQQFSNTEGAVIILRNAPKARIWGLEGEVRLRPVAGLYLSANAGWLDPKFLEADITPFDPLTGDISGNQLIGANKFTTTLSLDWRAVQTDVGDLNLRFDANYRSRTYFQPANPKDISQPGYWLANGRISFDMERFTIAAWGRNLFGKKYFVSSFDYSAAVGVDELNRGARRQFGIEGTVRF